MKYRILDWLCCPATGEPLQLHVFHETEQNGADLPEEYRKEIIDGIFTTSSGKVYPIIDAVPRFTDDSLITYREFIQQYAEQLRNIAAVQELIKSEDEFDDIRRSFSDEWEIFDYDQDNTWGWNLEQRKEVFRNDVAMSSDQLQGKVLFDAGCGNGSLTAKLTDFGLEVIGMDLHNGLARAQAKKGKFARGREHLVHYVQGNLFKPPFKKHTFDLIYSSGVIHHTPDSRQTFERIYPLVREGGRVYVWVYGKRPLAVVLFQGSGRMIRKVVPLKVLYLMCAVLAPFYKVTSEILNQLHIMHFRKRTTREITLDLFDAFSPQFNHRHTHDEVVEWFKRHHFRNVQISGIQKHGFGVYGDLEPQH
ncbi:MAG: class I SAM-dependent methyltransferase [bacterium]|jgi:SAM-dependent methyltransferase